MPRRRDECLKSSKGCSHLKQKLNRKDNQAPKDSKGSSLNQFAANRAGPSFLDGNQQDFASLPQEAAV